MQQQYQIKHQMNCNIINDQPQGNNNNTNMFRHKRGMVHITGQLNMASNLGLGTQYFSQAHTQPNIIPSHMMVRTFLKMYDKNCKSKSNSSSGIGSSTSRTMSTTLSKVSKNNRSYETQSTRTTTTKKKKFKEKHSASRRRMEDSSDSSDDNIIADNDFKQRKRKRKFNKIAPDHPAPIGKTLPATEKKDYLSKTGPVYGHRGDIYLQGHHSNSDITVAEAVAQASSMGIGAVGGIGCHIGSGIGIPAAPAFFRAKTISADDEIEHRLNTVTSIDNAIDEDDVTRDALEMANTANFKTLRMTQSSTASRSVNSTNGLKIVVLSPIQQHQMSLTPDTELKHNSGRNGGEALHETPGTTKKHVAPNTSSSFSDTNNTAGTFVEHGRSENAESFDTSEAIRNDHRDSGVLYATFQITMIQF